MQLYMISGENVVNNLHVSSEEENTAAVLNKKNNRANKDLQNTTQKTKD